MGSAQKQLIAGKHEKSEVPRQQETLSLKILFGLLKLLTLNACEMLHFYSIHSTLFRF